jgi:hypothetical protein
MLTNDDFRTPVLTPAAIDAATKRAHQLRSETFMSVMHDLGEAVLDLFSRPVRVTESLRSDASGAKAPARGCTAHG